MLNSLRASNALRSLVRSHPRKVSLSSPRRSLVRVQEHKVMKRSIVDYFGGTSPAKKPKLVEVSPAPQASAPVPVSPPKMPVKPIEETAGVSSNELSEAELQQIEINRKKALARRLFNKITEPSWREALEPEFEKPYMLELADFLAKERASGYKIFPSDENLFTALNICPLDSVKVVMLGQDPYHQPNQAHGLCFSVLPPTKPPSSLQNIYKELKSNYPKIVIPKHGNLETWAVQGILMLNAVLTVRYDLPDSHAGKGWEKFTDACIIAVSQKLRSVIFLLWGSKAQNKAKVADAKKHIHLKAPHPSGLSAHRGFIGCKHFIEVNTTLTRIGRTPIDWQLPDSGTPKFTGTASSSANSETNGSKKEESSASSSTNQKVDEGEAKKEISEAKSSAPNGSSTETSEPAKMVVKSDAETTSP